MMGEPNHLSLNLEAPDHVKCTVTLYTLVELVLV
jgi:hypothetical protein